MKVSLLDYNYFISVVKFDNSKYARKVDII